MKKLSTKGLLALASIVPFLVASVGFAQVDNLSDLKFGNQKISSEAGVVDLMARILNWVFGVLLVISVAMILYAGFLYVTGGGNEGQIKKAKNILTYAIIGIAIAILAKAIVIVVQSLLTQ